MAGFLKGLFSRNSKEEGAGGNTPPQAAPHTEKTELSVLCEKYYRMGKEYQQKGDLERARLYLERASTIYSNFEPAFDESEVLMYDCDEQIGALEEEDLLYNELLEQMTEASEKFSNSQNYIWGILSLARLQKVFEKLSVCPECSILGDMERVLDILCHGLEQKTTPEELGYLKEFVGDFYDFCDSETFVSEGNQVPVQEGKTLQVFDLNGNSTATCIHIFLDKCAYLLEAGFHTAEEGEPAEPDFIPGTLIADYYLRNYDGELRDIPQIQTEIARIRADQEFLEEGPQVQEVIRRIKEYRNLDILTA